MTLSEFERHIKEKLTGFGIEQGERIAIAFSGGADSVALLIAVKNSGFNPVALHCNFNLRGEESLRDRAFCKSLADSLDIPLYISDFDTISEKKNGESIEMVCRRLRYNWFDEQKKLLGIRILLTGHHLNDNHETFFLNLFRGTGIRGLSGIKPEGDNRCSPMLELTKSDILRYLEDLGQDYVTDSTNLESEYQRNKLRNIIIPAIETGFPDAQKGIETTIRNLSDAAALLDDYIYQCRSKYLDGNRLDLRRLFSEERNPEIVLYYLLEPFGFNRIQTDNIAESQTNGAVFLSKDYRAAISNGYLEIERIENRKAMPEIKVELKNRDEITEFVRNHSVLYLDADKVGSDPDFRLRNWTEGDIIKPFGMNGKTRLVSDILSDAKLSVIRKASVPLLTLDNDILWVYGLKESNLYRIDKSTRKVYVVTLG